MSLNQTTHKVPEGYLRNAQGHLVPLDTIADIDKDRDELVREIVTKAKALSGTIGTFKESAMGDVGAFVELAAEKYGATLGGIKGNVSLTSFDGDLKVQIAISDRLHFDERIQAAKSLVDECIHEWTVGARSEIKALVEHAFQTDKEGRLNTGRIISLTRLDIKDKKWKSAMDAIRDSMQVVSTRSYIRVYERQGDNGKYEQISLDAASV